MKTINNTHLISGGNPAAGAATAAAIITGTAAIIEAGKTFVELGHDIGEALYNSKHGADKPLGKMHYEKKDYSPAYLEYKYPAHSHPNNMHGNNFHSSFGGF